MDANIAHIQRVLTEAETKPYHVVTTSWEDACRTKGSVWGSNITDVRRVVGGTGKGLLLPVLRRSNYEHGTETCSLCAQARLPWWLATWRPSPLTERAQSEASL